MSDTRSSRAVPALTGRHLPEHGELRMNQRRWVCVRQVMNLFPLLLAALASPALAFAQAGTLRGTVVDPQGAIVSGASVTLIRDGNQVGQAPTDALGEFVFQSLNEGRYQVEVTAAGFENRRTDPVYVGSPVIQVTLQIGPLEQDVVVTAAATELPASQIGSPVTVLGADTIQALGKVDVLEPLRLVPGVLVAQAGGRGGVASLFVRGGNSNFNKVLVDGMAVNLIGGDFDFAQLATAGVESIEVLRSPNSVLYGSDTL